MDDILDFHYLQPHSKKATKCLGRNVFIFENKTMICVSLSEHGFLHQKSLFRVLSTTGTQYHLSIIYNISVAKSEIKITFPFYSGLFFVSLSKFLSTFSGLFFRCRI